MTAQTQSSELASLDDVIDRLKAATTSVLDSDQAVDVSDETIAEALYCAARLFAAKKDRVSDLQWPIATDALTATETVVLVAALLDAADVNIFDMAIWYRRV